MTRRYSRNARLAPLAAIVTLSVLWSATRLAAQDSRATVARDTNPAWTVGGTYVRIGGATLGLDELNDNLRRNGRPTFSNRAATFGISAFARRGRLLYGASIEQAAPHRAVEDEWVTKLAARGASLDAGLALMELKKTLVYSTVSLGLRSTSLHFERRGEFTYGEGLQDPARSLDLSSRTGVVQLGMTVERHFALRRTGMFALSIQAGMTRPLGSPTSNAGESKVAETPGQTSGRYVRVAIGKPLAKRGRVLNTIGAALFSSIFK